MEGMALPYRALAFAYRAVASLIILIGIARVTGLWSADPSWDSFLFFTVQSNVLCLVWMVWSAIVTVRDMQTKGWYGSSTPSARGEGFVMMAITVTMLIYLLVLVPYLFEQPGASEPFSLTDNLVHIICPVLVIVDWLLFIPKGSFRKIDPVLWAIIPYIYLIFAFAYGALGGDFGGGARVPYPFMDVEANGVGGVIAWIVGLTIALIAVGYVYYVIDQGLAGLNRRRIARRQDAGASSSSSGLKFDGSSV